MQHVNSDLAFRGNIAFNGNYNGWRTIDISNPNSPVELDWYDECNGNQGDIVVWENILIRSWNSETTGRTCGGVAVDPEFEGVHVFDITTLTNPQLVASVDMPCGSHTSTIAGTEGGNLIVYSNISSSTGCDGGNTDGDFMDVLSIPLSNPAGAVLLRREPLQGPTDPAVATGCHDVGVIRLDVNKAACASADTINVFDIGDNSTTGGTLSDPVLLFTITEPGVGQSTTNGRWHSAAWTWDGEVIAAGWEPGGGTQAECEATDPEIDKSMFFYNGTTGAKLGQWVLPRPQGPDENCTIHNYNVVPLTSGRYIVVGGHYQAGTWAVDFTNPASPQTMAWSDPPSLGPGTFCTDPPTETCQLGGAWSSYMYNDFVYESEIQAGLNVFQITDPRLHPDLVINLPFLNPQTQMEPSPGFIAAAVAAGPRCKGKNATHVGTNGSETIVGTSGSDVVLSLGGKDKVKSLGGKDTMCLGRGKDTGNGAGGRDRLFGQAGRDKLKGGPGRDFLHGGAKPDICNGGPGRDKAKACEVEKNIP